MLWHQKSPTHRAGRDDSTKSSWWQIYFSLSKSKNSRWSSARLLGVLLNSIICSFFCDPLPLLPLSLLFSAPSASWARSQFLSLSLTVSLSVSQALLPPLCLFSSSLCRSFSTYTYIFTPPPFSLSYNTTGPFHWLHALHIKSDSSRKRPLSSQRIEMD